MNRDAVPVVVISEPEAARSISARIDSTTGPVRWFASMKELLQEKILSSVKVLVVDTHVKPQGMLLAAIGRMHAEYPAMQTVALMDAEAPLSVVSYLASCGANLIWADDVEQIDQLTAAVDRARAAAQWCCQEKEHGRAA